VCAGGPAVLAGQRHGVRPDRPQRPDDLGHAGGAGGVPGRLHPRQRPPGHRRRGRGRPHAQVTYGYRRIYDSRTKALLRQEPDDEPRTAVGIGGARSQYTPAGIVAEVVTRLTEGATITALVRELKRAGRALAAGQGVDPCGGAQDGAEPDVHQ
jgi:hypothetical protein